MNTFAKNISLLSLLSIPAIATAMVNEASVTRIHNEVNVIPPEGQVFPASVGYKVQGSTGVRTGRKSRSQLSFPDDSIVRLGSQSFFSFKKRGDFELTSGTILLQTDKKTGGAQVRSGSVTAAITGTTVMMERDAQTNLIKFIVLEGEANVYYSDRPSEFTTVTAGQMVVFQEGNSLPSPIEVNIDLIQATSNLLTAGGFDDTVGSKEILIEDVIERQKKELARGRLNPSNFFVSGPNIYQIEEENIPVERLIELFVDQENETVASNEDTPVTREEEVSSTSSSSSSSSSTPSTPAQTLTTLSGTTTLNDNHTIQTNPTVFVTATTATVHTGLVSNANVDKNLYTFAFGSASGSLYNSAFGDDSSPRAGFRFGTLNITGTPTLTTSADVSQVLLAADAAMSLNGGGGGATWTFDGNGVNDMVFISDGTLNWNNFSFAVASGAGNLGLYSTEGTEVGDVTVNLDTSGDRGDFTLASTSVQTITGAGSALSVTSKDMTLLTSGVISLTSPSFNVTGDLSLRSSGGDVTVSDATFQGAANSVLSIRGSNVTLDGDNNFTGTTNTVVEVQATSESISITGDNTFSNLARLDLIADSYTTTGAVSIGTTDTVTLLRMYVGGLSSVDTPYARNATTPLIDLRDDDPSRVTEVNDLINLITNFPATDYVICPLTSYTNFDSSIHNNDCNP